MVRRAASHFWATSIPVVSRRQVRTRPSFSVCTRPLSSRICRCWITAVGVMLSGPAIGNRSRGFAEFFEDGATGRIAEGVEDLVDFDLRLGHFYSSALRLKIGARPPWLQAKALLFGPVHRGSSFLWVT